VVSGTFAIARPLPLRTKSATEPNVQEPDRSAGFMDVQSVAVHIERVPGVLFHAEE